MREVKITGRRMPTLTDWDDPANRAARRLHKTMEKYSGLPSYDEWRELLQGGDPEAERLLLKMERAESGPDLSPPKGGYVAPRKRYGPAIFWPKD